MMLVLHVLEPKTTIFFVFSLMRRAVLIFGLHLSNSWLSVIQRNLINEVDTGCFQHHYTNFKHTNMGMPKYNLR